MKRGFLCHHPRLFPLTSAAHLSTIQESQQHKTQQGRGVHRDETSTDVAFGQQSAALSPHGHYLSPFLTASAWSSPEGALTGGTPNRECTFSSVNKAVPRNHPVSHGPISNSGQSSRDHLPPPTIQVFPPRIHTFVTTII